MGQILIQDQLNAIHQVTNDALKSKESALKFLIDAGIVTTKTKPMSDTEEVEYNEEWTVEDQKRFEAKEEYFLKVMNGRCYTTTPYGSYLWEGNDIVSKMRIIFEAAQETVCINGKQTLVYKDLAHYLSANFGEMPSRP